MTETVVALEIANCRWSAARIQYDPDGVRDVGDLLESDYDVVETCGHEHRTCQCGPIDNCLRKMEMRR